MGEKFHWKITSLEFWFYFYIIAIKFLSIFTMGSDSLFGPISTQVYKKLTLRDELDLYWFLSKNVWNDFFVLDLSDYGKSLYPVP